MGGGDFNARLGADNTIHEALEHTRLRSTRQTLNDFPENRGAILQDFMSFNSFVIVNSRSVGDPEGSFTYSDTQGNSLIDHVWIDVAHADMVLDFVVDDTYINSDHFPIFLYLQSDIFRDVIDVNYENVQGHFFALK